MQFKMDLPPPSEPVREEYIAKIIAEWRYSRRRYLRSLRKMALLRAYGDLKLPSLELAIRQLEDDLDKLNGFLPEGAS